MTLGEEEEPIVLLMLLYLSVIYAILYMQFTSFPLVFEGQRHWSSGFSGLSFVGITIGAFVSLAYIVFYENPRCSRRVQAAGGYLSPEARLPSVIVGDILLPYVQTRLAHILFHRRTHYHSVDRANSLYGAGIVLLFLGISNFLIDAYLIYSASVLAGGTVMRSAFGVVVPLFTNSIYTALGIRWAGAMLVFLGLAFVPVPIILSFYGARIRRSSQAAREADDVAQMMAAKIRAARAPAAAAAAAPSATAAILPRE